MTSANPTSLSGLLVAGPLATTPNPTSGPAWSRVETSTPIPAEARNFHLGHIDDDGRRNSSPVTS